MIHTHTHSHTTTGALWLFVYFFVVKKTNVKLFQYGTGALTQFSKCWHLFFFCEFNTHTFFQYSSLVVPPVKWIFGFNIFFLFYYSTSERYSAARINVYFTHRRSSNEWNSSLADVCFCLPKELCAHVLLLLAALVWWSREHRIQSEKKITSTVVY